MSESMTFVQPVAGPHRPLSTTPDRRPGSVRRTTSIDVTWPDFERMQVQVVVRGQDLVTDASGSAAAASALDVTFVAELATGRVVEVDGGDDHVARCVEGASLRSGFRRHLASVDPEGAAARTLAYSVLEDVPGAFLVSGYSLLRAGMLDGDPEAARARAPKQADVCIGWRTDGPVHVALEGLGRNAVPYGPDAPALEAEEQAGWHVLDPLAHGTVRRRRQLDVWPEDDGGLGVQAHFRDSYAGDGPEMVMHEYLLHAAVGADRRVASVSVQPRVLPWQACPGAVASAQVVVGVPLDQLDPVVRTEADGPGGCTHLTSTLRSLADVGALGALARRA